MRIIFSRQQKTNEGAGVEKLQEKHPPVNNKIHHLDRNKKFNKIAPTLSDQNIIYKKLTSQSVNT